jgi:hydroxylysine kinase
VTGVIDFGDVVRTRVVFDVAVGMANVIGTDPDDPWGTAAAFLSGYQQTRPLPDADVDLLREIALGRLLLRALVVDWRAHIDPDRHAYLLSHANRDWSCLERAHATDPDLVRTMLRATSTAPLPTND